MSERLGRATPLPVSVSLSDLTAATKDKLVKAALQGLDRDGDGIVKDEEIDADANGRLDDVVALAKRLNFAQFSEFESILKRHGLPVQPLLPTQTTLTFAPVEPELRPVAGNERPVPDVLRDYLEKTTETCVEFVPEYDYKRFYYHLSPELAVAEEQLRLARLILESSPRTQVFLTNAQGLEDMIAEMIPEELKSRAPVISWDVAPDIWAQDYGEATGGNDSRYVAGWVYSPLLGRQTGLGSRGLDEEGTALEIAQVRVPFTLQGGNLTKTTLQGRNIVVVGADDVEDTINQYRNRYGYDISDDTLMLLYRRTFGADDVVVLENCRKAFHIDQMTLFAADGKVIMPRLPYSDAVKPAVPETQLFLATLLENKRRLEGYGFEVIEIPVAWDMIGRYEAFTNAITVTAEGSTRLIMPSFGESELEKEAARILKEHGFDVVFSANTTSWRQGNSHCLTGVLAEGDIDAKVGKNSA